MQSLAAIYRAATYLQLRDLEYDWLTWDGYQLKMRRASVTYAKGSMRNRENRCPSLRFGCVPARQRTMLCGILCTLAAGQHYAGACPCLSMVYAGVGSRHQDAGGNAQCTHGALTR